MWEDPIVAEVHRTREQLAAAQAYNLAAFFADVRKRQTALGERLVPQPTRRDTTPQLDRARTSQAGDATSSEAAPAA
jgi:hypothetical protein